MRGDSEITNSEDIIDSRSVTERIAYLEGERDSFVVNGVDERGNSMYDPTKWAEANPEDAEELAALLKLQEEAEGYVEDWKYGATLIRDSYFEQYAEELAEEIGAVSQNVSWPNNHIDWKAAAEELKQDYTSVDFDGVEYWVR